MVYQQELTDWINGNHSQIDRDGLLRLVFHFERLANGYESEVEQDE